MLAAMHASHAKDLVVGGGGGEAKGQKVQFLYFETIQSGKPAQQIYCFEILHLTVSVYPHWAG